MATLATLLAATLGLNNGLGRPDNLLYDAAVSRLGAGTPADIVIVAIDEDSLRVLGRWPWRRVIVATLLQTIASAQPRGIAVDLVLSETDSRDPSGDLYLSKALHAHPRVVLPVLMEAGPGRLPVALLPAPVFREAGVRLGHAHFEVDADGLVRSVFLEEGVAKQSWPALGLALAKEELAASSLPGMRAPPIPRAGSNWHRDYWMHLAFAGPPGTVSRVSAAGVLSGEIPVSELADKYVLLGATAAGLGDAYPTPVTGMGELMPGVELHAQLVDNLLRGRAIALASPLANALFTIVPLWIALAAFLRLSPRQALLTTASLMAITLAAALAAMAIARIWFAPTAALLMLALAYPAWSWRRIEAAVTYLGEEFERLKSEPAIVPQAPAPWSGADGDLLDRRIASVSRAADSLRHARRFIADSIEHLPVATVVLGLDERVLIANRLAAEGFGAIGPEALRDTPLVELLTQIAPAQPGLWSRAKETLGTEGEPAVEFADARERRYLLHIAHCFDASGAVVGFLVNLVNITPIREAERRRDEALAFVSHDLRSPQASILAAVELTRIAPDEFPAAKMFDQIEAYAKRTIALAEEFVELSRAETTSYRMERCDLNDIAREAVGQVQPQALEKSIRIALLSCEAAPITGDRRLLLRAVVNLAGNAVKYSPQNTAITVSVSMDGSRARCAVRDEGYGISPEDQKRLFGHFTRVSVAGQPRTTGIGLGLAFVKAVIERHGGGLEVTSAPGKGSEFAFALDAAGA